MVDVGPLPYLGHPAHGVDRTLAADLQPVDRAWLEWWWDQGAILTGNPAWREALPGETPGELVPEALARARATGRRPAYLDAEPVDMSWVTTEPQGGGGIWPLVGLAALLSTACTAAGYLTGVIPH